MHSFDSLDPATRATNRDFARAWRIFEARALVLVEWAAGLAAASSIAICLVAASRRLAYRFSFGPNEGVILEHVQRLLEARPLYVKPSLEWVPLHYTPLYYYVAGALTPVFGGGHFPLKLVTVLATFGSMGLIAAFAYKETGKRLLALLAAGIFSATYVLAQCWYDCTRVDMLMVFVLLAALFTLRFKRGPLWSAVTVTLFILAFLSKQTALCVLPAVGLYCFYRDGLKSIRLLAGLAIGLTLTLVAAHLLTQGWFTYYVFSLHSHHKFTSGLAHARTAFVGVFPLLFVIAAGIWAVDRKECRDTLIFYGSLFAALAFTSSFTSMKSGGDVNHFIPLFAVSAVLGATLIGRLRTKRVRLVLLLAVIFQFIHLGYPDLATPFPSRESQAKFEQSQLEALRQVSGDVFFLHPDNYVATLAGKKRFANHTAIMDLFWAMPNPHADALISELRSAIESRAFGGFAINLDEGYDPHFVSLNRDPWARDKPGLMATLRKHYEPVTTVPPVGVLYPFHQFTLFKRIPHDGH